MSQNPLPEGNPSGLPNRIEARNLGAGLALLVVHDVRFADFHRPLGPVHGYDDG